MDGHVNNPEDPLIYDSAFPVTVKTGARTYKRESIGSGLSIGWNRYSTENGFLFQTFYHPYVSAFVRELNQNGVDGLLQRNVQTSPDNFVPRAPNAPPVPPLDFDNEYQPGAPAVSEPIVFEPYPAEDVDFDEDGAYALYNWELFFHAPL